MSTKDYFRRRSYAFTTNAMSTIKKKQTSSSRKTNKPGLEKPDAITASTKISLNHDVELLNRVLRHVKLLRKQELEKNIVGKPTLNDLGIDDIGKEVVELSEDRVLETIEEVFLGVTRDILLKNGLNYVIPSRSNNNQIYVPELDRIVLKNAVTNRSLANVSTVRKSAITTRILQLVHEVVEKRIHITKRDLFYTDVKLFKKQSESDTVIDDVACMIGCTRNSLNVVASEKGVVVGRCSFRDDGDFIDCTKMGVGGKAIPSLIDRITDIQGDAEFILLVEKDAAFIRLSEDRFYNTYPCVIITAKGQPDVATRQKLKASLRIPILGLVDSDPYGLKILSVYMSGSKNMSYDSAHLTVSDIKWLGVRPSDLDLYHVPKECRLEMTEADLKTGKELLQEDFIQKNPGWVKELELMIKKKEKAEIQALSNFGFQFLTRVYLPEKLERGDWI